VRVLLAVALAIAACGSPAPSRASAPPAAPSRTDASAQDARLIGALYALHNAAWESGPEAGCDAVIATAYPPMRAAPDYKLTRADCLTATFKGSPAPDGYQEVEIPDLATLQTADGWTIPVGSLKGRPIAGRIYVLTLRTLIGVKGIPPQDVTETVHVVVADGSAYDFTTYGAN
jgi:hypothetical protein